MSNGQDNPEKTEPKLPMPETGPFGGLAPRLPPSVPGTAAPAHVQAHVHPHVQAQPQPQIISVSPAPIILPQATAYPQQAATVQAAAQAAPPAAPIQPATSASPGPSLGFGDSSGSGASGNPPPRSPRFRSRRIRRAIFCLKAVTAVCVAAFIGIGALLSYYTLAFPNPFQVGGDKRSPVIQILARDGSLLAERGRPHDYIPLQLLPLHVTNAVLATEDRRFYAHWGIDPSGMARAAFANLRAGRFVQGGSTITQQLAKNLFLSSERTLARKIEELTIALWLEMRLSKQQILELYLNQVYFGAGAYGIEAASQKYFGKSARALSIREAALVAGLLQAPTRYSPFRNPGLARQRGNTVIAKMQRAGFLDAKTAKNARNARLKFAKADANTRTTRDLGYAIDYVLAHMPQLSSLEQGIIIVETTIDASLQRKAQSVLRRALDRARKGRRARGQGAIVVLDGEGEVRAIVGGRSYAQSQFNRAIKAQRQPGSAFKPFVYLAALESGLTPETTVYDLPVTIGDWSPRNASGRFEGAMPLERGISKSVNTVAVRLQQQLGPDAVIQSARRLGIQSKLRRDPTLALGTSEVSTLEMTAAYATLANGGLKVGPHVIRRVRTHSGRLLFAPSARSSPRVLAGETVGQMSRMLSAVVERGTGRRAAFANHPAAGKTGTTQDARDAWFVGYTRHLTAGIWIGQDGRGPSLTGLSGGTLPAEVWRDVMAFAHDDLRPLPLAWYGGAKARPLTSRAKLKPKSKPKPKSRPTPVAKRRPTRRPKTLAKRRVPVARVTTPRRRTRTQTAPRLAERTAIFARRIPALPKRRPTRVVRRKAPARAIAPPRVPVANPSLDQRFIADAIRETERLETRKLARSELERTRRARQFDAEAIRRMLAEAQSPAGPAPVPSRYRRPQTLMGLGKPPR